VDSNNNIKWVYEKGHGMYDEKGRFQWLDGAIFDITEQTLIRENIKQQKEFINTLIETLPSPIFYKDKEGRYLGCNKAYEEFIGKNRSEVIGKSVYDMAPKEIADKYYEKDKELFDNPGTQYYEWVVKKKNGGIKNVIFNKATFNDHDGKVAGLIGGISDITKLKKLTDELKRSNAELDRFAYVAAHDMKSPLGMIINSLQIIERSCRGKIEKEADVFIDHAIKGAQRMNDFIVDLLNYSRLTTEPRPYTVVNAEKVLKDALFNLEQTIKDNNAKIEYNSLPEIKVDEMRIVQLFQNLINNAVKFRGKDAPVVKISCKKEDSSYVFSVKDNGIGIDSKNIEKVFQMFGRLHSNDEYPGNGIGLSVCKKIVENHGGKIWVESEPGKGTNFLFTIPTHFDY
jgi:PAS domain S-box-containing protein